MRFMEDAHLKKPSEGKESGYGPLKEVFDVFPRPNPAEIKFLALCLNFEEKSIKEWCKYPSERGMKPLFDILHIVRWKRLEKSTKSYNRPIPKPRDPEKENEYINSQIQSLIERELAKNKVDPKLMPKN